MSKRPLTGGHVSAAGGPVGALARGEAEGFETIQIFGASPRAWKANQYDASVPPAFKKAHKESSIQTVFLHASYLVNLGSDNPELVEKSVANLAAHLELAESIGAEGLVFHPGSAGKQSVEETIEKHGINMNRVLDMVPGKAKLIIENTAGQGTKVGHSAKEVGDIMKAANHERVAVCMDTAHVCGAGHIDDFSDKKKLKTFLADWEKEVGLKNIIIVHANDSKVEYGSKKDRHENIGDGFIGIKGFEALCGSGALNHASWNLEVPGIEGNGPDKENVERLRACFS